MRQQVDVIADFGDLCGECPIWHADEAVLYWTDCGGRKFYRYQSANGKSELIHHGLEINGFRRIEGGGFVLTNNSGIWLWPGAGSEPEELVVEVSGAACRMNDCVADEAGRLLACSWFYDGSESYALGKLLQVGLDRSLTILDEGFHLANGLAFSPCGKKLYVTDSALRRIYEYDYAPAAGSVHNRSVLVKVPDEEGLPDGLKVDSEGFLWSAQWYGSCIVRYDPGGKVERRIPVPAKQVSSLTFGDADLTTLFITTAGQSEVMPLMPAGYDPYAGHFGGPVYAVKQEIKGLPDLAARIPHTGMAI
jgi:D-xylonolactonase